MPNPFADELTVAFDLAQPSKTKLVLLDVTGTFQFMQRENDLQTGRQKLILNTEDLPAGAYLIGLKTDHEAWVWRKVMLVR